MPIIGGGSGGGGASLPSQVGQGGKFLGTDGTNASWGTPAGGSSLAVQDFKVEYPDAVTVYEAIAAAGTAVSAASWSLIKTVLTGSTYATRQVYIATDSWNNRATATYTLSNTYNV